MPTVSLAHSSHPSYTSSNVSSAWHVLTSLSKAAPPFQVSLYYATRSISLITSVAICNDLLLFYLVSVPISRMYAPWGRHAWKVCCHSHSTWHLTGNRCSVLTEWPGSELAPVSPNIRVHFSLAKGWPWCCCPWRLPLEMVPRMLQVTLTYFTRHCLCVLSPSGLKWAFWSPRAF